MADSEKGEDSEGGCGEELEEWKEEDVEKETGLSTEQQGEDSEEGGGARVQEHATEEVLKLDDTDQTVLQPIKEGFHTRTNLITVKSRRFGIFKNDTTINN